MSVYPPRENVDKSEKMKSSCHTTFSEVGGMRKEVRSSSFFLKLTKRENPRERTREENRREKRRGEKRERERVKRRTHRQRELCKL